MEDTRPYRFTRPRFVLSLVASLAVFAFWMFMLRPFVPELPPVAAFAALTYTAFSLTGVFFLAFNMFLVVLLDPVASARTSRDRR